MRYYDNTRISSFRGCPRMFFYRHIMHWVPDSLSPALAFGLSWHDAMDAVWIGIQDGLADRDVVEAGYAAFLERWQEEGFPHPRDMSLEQIAYLDKRTPMTALEMLGHYVIERRPFIETVKLLSVERPFAVQLEEGNNKLFYVGKTDKAYEERGKIWGVDHKTTSEYKKDGYFKGTFIQSFSPNAQMDGYLYALSFLHDKPVKGMMIDAALVHKTVHHGFRLIPIVKAFEHIDAWLWETHYWINMIEQSKQGFEECQEGDEHLMAFPKNTDRCGDWGGCTYLDICQVCTNPLRLQDPPDGFKKEPWSPYEILELDKIGLNPEDEEVKDG